MKVNSESNKVSNLFSSNNPKKCKRSQVQGSPFRVKDKEGIKEPKPKFWIRPDEADAFVINTHPKCSPGMRMQPRTQNL
jgi:hypothetical protein